MATNYYNKGEVDTLIAGAGGGVSNPIELVDANTSIERYTNATKSNVSLDLSINETASAIRLELMTTPIPILILNAIIQRTEQHFLNKYFLAKR